MNGTLSTPRVQVCTLPKATHFKVDDVLYKIVDGDLCKYLVLEIKGECRIKLRAYQKSGDLSNNTFEIQNKELNLYQLDIAHTKVRTAYLNLVKK